MLLCHHPSLPVFTDLARAALEDPAELVRLAAAGALAYHGDGSGEAQLVKGLEHPRWEVRWWCGKSLAYLERGGSKRAIAGALQREPDGWVKGEMEKMLAALK